VRSRDSAPDDSDSAAVDLTLGLVDVGDSLVVSGIVGYQGGSEEVKGLSGLVWSGLVSFHASSCSSSPALELLLLARMRRSRAATAPIPKFLFFSSCDLSLPRHAPLHSSRLDQTRHYPSPSSLPPTKEAHLSEVCSGVLLGVDTLNLDQRLVRSRVPLSSLVSENSTLAV
jgi:hypothetical protein